MIGAMDAATLFMIKTLADGREDRRALREYPTVAACEAFVAEANRRKPTDMAEFRYECWRHYRVAPGADEARAP